MSGDVRNVFCFEQGILKNLQQIKWQFFVHLSRVQGQLKKKKKK